MPPGTTSNLIFKHCIVSIADDLDDYDWREEKVRQWVSYWGGQFSSTVDASVTHLLCTERNFKMKIAPVRVALKNKGTRVVLRDWLEDSINKKVCLKTQPYQLDEKAKREEKKKRQVKKIEQMRKNADKYVDERFWHIYRDSTHFEYQVQLTRNDEESGNVGEKHLLTLWESNAKPHNYICTTLFTKPKRKGSRCTLFDSPVGLDVAFGKFKSFFKKKTHILWDDRVERKSTTGPEYFQYQPPSGGKPVGLIGRRKVSIVDEDSTAAHLTAFNLAKEEEQFNDGLVEEVYAANNHCKRRREENITDDDDPIGADDEERPAKKARCEGTETRHVHFETGTDAIRQTIVSSPGSEPEEGMQNDQGHDELPSDEPMQDTNGEHEVQTESSNVINDGYDGHEQDHDSSDGYETAIEDGLAASNNSEGDEQGDGEPLDATHHEDYYAEVVDDYYTYSKGDDDENDDISPADRSALAAARAAAQNIYDDSMRGVTLVSDSQAELIDAEYEKQAYIRARAEKSLDREETSESEEED
ncbi:hypothetical protein GQX73_g3267 [Xylaria multiplex]|uniref:Uncharacterized protein n=1 Tax=Xylaria multiplex TaxID=323545 RepID=A0A7C8MSE7_9PEZI|nr:hypothetical protein GQX73_g3267 [Xylaria multiplex]